MNFEATLSSLSVSLPALSWTVSASLCVYREATKILVIKIAFTGLYIIVVSPMHVHQIQYIQEDTNTHLERL